MPNQQLITEQAERFFEDPQRGGMRVKVGTFPCTFPRDQPHPVASADGRRFARFRRHIEGGIEYARGRGYSIHFVTLAMRYDVGTGELKGDLRYSTQRFIQILRRKGLELEYLRVVETTQAGVTNHAHLVLAVKGDFPPEHDLKDAWAHATKGSSYQVKSIRANADVGWLSRYLSKALGSYLSKSFPEAEGRGLDGSDRNATVQAHVSTSRGWLPTGAESKWVEFFHKNAFFWLCDRGFWHTDMGETGKRWLEWINLQAWAQK